MNYNSAKRAKGEGELKLINREKAKAKGELILISLLAEPGQYFIGIYWIPNFTDLQISGPVRIRFFAIFLLPPV